MTSWGRCSSEGCREFYHPAAGYLWEDNSSLWVLPPWEHDIYGKTTVHCEFYQPESMISVGRQQFIVSSTTLQQDICGKTTVHCEFYHPAAGYLWEDNSSLSVLPPCSRISVGRQQFIVSSTTLQQDICGKTTVHCEFYHPAAGYLWEDNSSLWVLPPWEHDIRGKTTVHCEFYTTLQQDICGKTTVHCQFYEFHLQHPWFSSNIIHDQCSFKST